MQVFACLISKLLCNNVYQSLDVRDEKRASLELKHRLDRQRPIWKASMKVLGRKIIFYVFILIFLRKLVLSFLCMTGSHYALHHLTKIATHSKVVSRKVLNGLKSKRSLWKALSKRQTVRIIILLTLRNALRKSRRKFFAYLINS